MNTLAMGSSFGVAAVPLCTTLFQSS